MFLNIPNTKYLGGPGGLMI